MGIWLVHHISSAVKSQDIISHTTCSSWFHLMLMSEKPLSCHASAIVELSMSQYTK